MNATTATATANAPKTVAKGKRASDTPATTKPAVNSSAFDIPRTTPAPSATAKAADLKKPDGAAVSAEIAGPILTLKFKNGGVITVDSNALSPDIIQHAIMHGLKQKLVDGAAIGRDPVTGRTATIDDKFDAVQEIYNRIIGAGDTEPSWNKVREGGAGPVKGGMLVAAMMELTGKTRDAIITYLDGLTKDEKSALRDNKRVAPIIVRLQAEKAARTAPKADGVDSDALLDGLMGDESGEGEGEEADE